MTEIELLDGLFEDFKRVAASTHPSRRSAAVNRLVRSIRSCVSDLEKKPTKQEITERLLTNKSAIRIREIWQCHKRLFDLKSIGSEIGLDLKRVTLDHILAAYFHPVDRLAELEKRFEEIARHDPVAAKHKAYTEWRAKLRSLKSREEMENGLSALMRQHDETCVRDFAEYLRTPHLASKTRLRKDAQIETLIRAVANQLWQERLDIRAQEGR